MPKIAGSSASPLADWHATPIQGTCIGERVIAARVVFSSAGAVSSVSGIGVSVVTQATGVYRVYIPKCADMCPQLTYGTTATWANGVGVSVVSPTSGYFDMVISSAAALSAPASGDFVAMSVVARTRKASV